MNIEKLDFWELFEDMVENGLSLSSEPAPLYRGQRNADWTLETTLERYGAYDYDTLEYRRNILRACRAVETVTGRTWNLSENLEIKDDQFKPPNGYPFMAFLRQNGFPSPLLDWSRSAYVAAFFAFHHADPLESKYVSIFKYVEHIGFGKSGSAGEATICSLGPWITTDKKHFLQQSEYTVCRKIGKEGLSYVSHEEAFARNNEEQDILTKYLIPISEKDRVLKKLKRFNITIHSLFETIESLMEILAADVLKIDRAQATKAKPTLQ
jgi:hypothetical protein